MNRTLLALSAFSLLALISCDRHEWEGEDGTSQLFLPHGGDHGDHHDDHGKKDDHKEKADH